MKMATGTERFIMAAAYFQSSSFFTNRAREK